MSDHFGIIQLEQQLRPMNEIDLVSGSKMMPGNTAYRIQHAGHAMFGQNQRVVGPHKTTEVFPFERNGLMINGKIRLDNRKSLIRALGLRSQNETSTSNGLLVLQSFEKWGERCCEQLLGDFSFAIWNGKARTLFIGRDTFGTGSVYFHQANDRFIFSSSLTWLLQQEGIPQRPDELVAALSLLAINKADGSRTFYEQIRQVPSAHYLALENRRVSLQQYWSWDDIPAIRYTQETDYIEDFHERFSSAVSARISPDVETGITLSGGIDSGAVASVASHQLGKSGKILNAFTSVPKYSVGDASFKLFLCDERMLAQETAQHIGNTHLALVEANEFSPLAGITKAFTIIQQPLVAASNCYWLISIYQKMQAAGVGTVLSGQFGNATISWQGNPSVLMRSLMMNGQIGQAYKEFRAYQSTYGLSLIDSLRRLVLAPMIPEPILEYRRYTRAGPQPWAGFTPLNSDFAEYLTLRNVMLQQGAFAFSASNSLFRRFLMPLGIFSGTSVGAALAGGFDLEYCDPTTDRRLIEFCFGIPESQYYKKGESRLLARHSFRDRLPHSVLDNTKFGLQSSDLVMRLRSSHDEFSQALKQATNSGLCNKFLDIKLMKSVFESAQVSCDYKTTLQTSSILMRGLMLAEFLQTFEN